MKLAAAVYLFFGVLVVAVFCADVGVTKADHNGDFLPVYNKVGQDITALPAQNRALNRGWINYCFDASAADYPGFRSQARQVVEYATSQTTIAAVEVPWGDDCDIRNVMPPDQTFLNTCGQGAAACIYYWSLPVTIYYRRSLNFFDWKSTFCHEGLSTGHFMGQHEEYDDQAFRSNGRFWTCMDFGTGTWQLPPFDRDRIWNSWAPDRPSAVGLRPELNGWYTATWTQRRADEGAAHAFGIPFNTNATRMAFGYSDIRDGPITWAGERCGERFNYCYTDYKDGQRSFDQAWKGCIWGRVEAPATYRAPQFTRGDSADGYWFLFGCF
ncbi:MAG TPA: hypothetical protein VLA89_17070 [Gemmatimonadales bacterium]|nr:hypothetical protein [Gemmatimonadales bacterium]